MIPVCEPLLTGKELDYVADCLKTNWISSMGKYIAQFETRFAGYCGCKHGVSTTNGTAALHLALAALGIGPGDEVILPAFTMAASAFSIIYTGARPVLVDSEPETWNMAASGIEEKITGRTKAIMAVHIYGHPCDMDPISEIARRHHLYVVEDAADHGRAVIQAGIVGDLVERAAGAGLGVVGAVNHCGDAGLDDGAGAHGAGLQRDVQRTIEEPPGA